MSPSRSGVAFGIGAYGLWGLFPLYLKQLSAAGDVEILAHRVAWSLVVVVGVLAVTRRLRTLGRLSRRTYLLLALAAVLITANWGTYIYAVNNGQIVEAALGYYINPLVTVALGVLVLGERLRRDQWLAIGIAGLGVVVLTADYGHPPWISLTLACSFGTYGLVKKRAGVGAVTSLGVETMVLFLPAFGYLALLGLRGDGAFGQYGWTENLLLIGCGLVTAVPLMLFGAAAVRLPLTVLGPLQYLTPTMQFLLGVLLYGEQVPPLRLAGFVLIWIALAVLTVGMQVRRRRDRAARPVAAT